MKPGRASDTSFVIAAATIISSLDPSQRELVAPEAASWCATFLAATPIGRRWARRAQRPLSRAAARFVERSLLPGIFCHYQCRKRVIENRWNHFREAGGSQLLIVGAGLDTLGVRIATSNPNVRVIEIDHPDTQHSKRSVISELPNLSLVAADLSTSLPSMVLASVLDPARPTFIVLEGVLMYLTSRQIHDLWADLRSLDVPRSTMIATFMEPDGRGRPAFHPRSKLIDLWLQWTGEPMFSSFTHDSASHALDDTGWNLLEYLDALEMAREAGIAPARTIRGESIAVANWNVQQP